MENDYPRIERHPRVSGDWVAYDERGDFIGDYSTEQEARDVAGLGPKHPEGTPEYDAYAANLRAELKKFAAGEPPYERDVFSMIERLTTERDAARARATALAATVARIEVATKSAGQMSSALAARIQQIINESLPPVESDRVEVGADGCGCPITERQEIEGTSIEGTERTDHRRHCWQATKP